MITFTAEQIAAFDKAQCKALLSKFDGMLDAATKAALSARIEKLERPPEPTPFPKQAELSDAFAQIKYWSDTAKDLIKQARDGNHTWIDQAGETKGKRAPRAARQPRESKSTDGDTASSITVQTEDGQTFTSFRLAADYLGLTDGMTVAKVNSVSWRRCIKAPVTVTFADEGMFESFRDRMTDGAAGKLPNWAGMENFTLVSPDGETWKL